LRKRLRKHLSGVLSAQDLESVYNSHDIIGDIAIFRSQQASLKSAQNIAEAIMRIHKNVKTVLAQVGSVAGDFRLRRLLHVAGENRTTTFCKESGCLFSVDVEKCYFSPRLFYERSRIAGLVRSDETVANMFAGVGCFSIVIAKRLDVAKVLSIDVSPAAIQFMHENIRINRVYGKVIPILGDSKMIVEQQLKRVADRVLMPLPEKAFSYLLYAVSALKTSGGWVHYYDFEHAGKNENPVEKVKWRVAKKLSSLNVAFEFAFSRVVRSTGPNWYQVVLDIHITRIPDKF
jgi:tRNA (guanine37-N1)-methyltransferase